MILPLSELSNACLLSLISSALLGPTAAPEKVNYHRLLVSGLKSKIIIILLSKKWQKGFA
jgi:hypothetical protein